MIGASARPASPLFGALPRLFQARRKRRRPEPASPTDRDPGRVLSTFFPFDVRDLVGGGPAEARNDRQ
jgi:hypothetical protein